jgi:hypothetical protein
MTSTTVLSRLEAVSLRVAWPDEAANFTPWLAIQANLDLLAERIGVPLHFEAREKAVGAFSADILAKEVDTGRWVIIENQITPTDHSHLGQLLTYAAGLEARTIIWIAESFREEHRAAIDFLNRATTEEFAFFGIRVQLYRIGDSPPAPEFTVIAKPNDWSKRTLAAKKAATADEGEVERQWREYWSALVERSKGRYPALSARTPYRGNWQTFETLRGGNPSFVLNASFPWDKSLRVEIYIDGTLAKAAFKALYDQKPQIEAAFGQPLEWEELPEGRASRIAFYMPGSERRGEQSTWEKQQEWLIAQGLKLADKLRPFVNSVQVQKAEPVAP